jgi:hypothetical protein
MLLVNDDESERSELRRFREERVCANQKGDAPIGGCRANAATLCRRGASYQ